MVGKASVDTEVTQTSHTSHTLTLRAWGAEEETEEALRGAKVPRPSQCFLREPEEAVQGPDSGL